MTLAVERRTREPESDPRRLAGLRAGQAQPDRLAGRESDRARRRAADPGDRRSAPSSSGSSSSGCRRSPSKPPSNAGARVLPEIAEPLPLGQLLEQRDGARRSISPTRAAASRRRRPSSRPGDDPDRPRRRLHRRGARRDPRRRRTPSPSRSARASCAPKPPRWPPSPLIWRWPGTGAKRRSA